MNAVFKNRAALTVACVAMSVVSMTCIATIIEAQPTVAATADQDAGAIADKTLAERVQAALKADPNLLSRHIKVSVEKGAVVLSGFVFSDWDLRTALRDAKKVAGDTQVVNNLSIKASERR
jgi:osmotically-inducible protein OsmY